MKPAADDVTGFIVPIPIVKEQSMENKSYNVDYFL